MFVFLRTRFCSNLLCNNKSLKQRERPAVNEESQIKIRRSTVRLLFCTRISLCRYKKLEPADLAGSVFVVFDYAAGAISTVWISSQKGHSLARTPRIPPTSSWIRIIITDKPFFTMHFLQFFLQNFIDKNKQK